MHTASKEPGHRRIVRIALHSAPVVFIAGLIIASLQFAGIIQMMISWICLLAAWVVAVGAIWFSDHIWGWKLRAKLLVTAGTALSMGVAVFLIGLFELSAQPPKDRPPEKPPVRQPTVSLPVRSAPPRRMTSKAMAQPIAPSGPDNGASVALSTLSIEALPDGQYALPIKIENPGDYTATYASYEFSQLSSTVRQPDDVIFNKIRELERDVDEGYRRAKLVGRAPEEWAPHSQQTLYNPFAKISSENKALMAEGKYFPVTMFVAKYDDAKDGKTYYAELCAVHISDKQYVSCPGFNFRKHKRWNP
ncbi:MAG: hypothetical protein JSR45_17640 [Proteobacteria bacterium]|nr:hypothetical protein [Pseudomonadota bacterium]